MNVMPSLPDDSSTPGDLDRRWLLGVAGLAGVAALSRMTQAGPINPPAGSVASTSKALSEVEPRTAVNATNTPGDSSAVFVISSTGSYYLPSNIAVPAGKVGIKVTATNATIDLNGFTIDGFTSGAGGISTVGAAGGGSLAISNGTVRGMAGTGIQVYAQALQVTNVAVQDCTGTGLDLSGNIIRVSACGSFRNGLHGFNLGGGTVSNCVSESNTGAGFNCFGTVVYESCVSSQNPGGGFSGGYLRALNCVCIASGVGYKATNGLAADGCWASYGTAGYQLGNSNTPFSLTGCVADSIQGVGFDLQTNIVGGQMHACVARNCTGIGFRTSTGATLNACIARTNTGGGFQAASATFFGCLAYGNGSVSPNLFSGFNLNSGCRVDQCAAISNGQHGFLLGNGCVLSNCLASQNFSTGVMVTSVQNSVDSCTVTGNGVGIQCTVNSNIFTRNRLTGNSPNLSITGPSFVGTSVTTAANVATANAWANFEF